MIKIKHINASQLVRSPKVLSHLLTKCQEYHVTDAGNRGTSDQDFQD